MTSSIVIVFESLDALYDALAVLITDGTILGSKGVFAWGLIVSWPWAEVDAVYLELTI